VLTFLAYIALAMLIGVFVAFAIDTAIVDRRGRLRADAERQHAALMRGDERTGFYGEYPPAI
jgi:hypothetical protein